MSLAVLSGNRGEQACMESRKRSSARPDERVSSMVDLTMEEVRKSGWKKVGVVGMGDPLMLTQPLDTLQVKNEVDRAQNERIVNLEDESRSQVGDSRELTLFKRVGRHRRRPELRRGSSKCCWTQTSYMLEYIRDSYDRLRRRRRRCCASPPRCCRRQDPGRADPRGTA